MISLLRNFGEVLRGNQVSEFSSLFIYVFFLVLGKLTFLSLDCTRNSFFLKKKTLVRIT